MTIHIRPETDGCTELTCLYHGEENMRKIASACNDMSCPEHGVAASNARQSEFYAKHPRG